MKNICVLIPCYEVQDDKVGKIRQSMRDTIIHLSLPILVIGKGWTHPTPSNLTYIELPKNYPTGIVRLLGILVASKLGYDYIFSVDDDFIYGKDATDEILYWAHKYDFFMFVNQKRLMWTVFKNKPMYKGLVKPVDENIKYLEPDAVKGLSIEDYCASMEPVWTWDGTFAPIRAITSNVDPENILGKWPLCDGEDRAIAYYSHHYTGATLFIKCKSVYHNSGRSDKSFSHSSWNGKTPENSPLKQCFGEFTSPELLRQYMEAYTYLKKERLL